MAGWDCPELPARWRVSARPAFVGRERESAVLRDAWALASRGIRQVVFVGGEPGVGKSRFVAENAIALNDGHAAVLLGTCVSTLGAPYQPFVEPLGALAAPLDDGALPFDTATADRVDATHRALQSLRTLTGVVVREDRDRAGDVPDPQFARQLFDAAAQVLVAATRVRPMILVLEDVQWAGDSALELLRYLVSRTADCRLLIVATQRTGAPDRSAALVSTVAQLYRLDGVGRIDLAGLETDEIADYIIDVAGSTRRNARGSATVLRDLTGGNPFLMREVWRDLSARGGLSALADLDLQAPESLRDTISHRLTGLPEIHRRSVEIAAVIGEEFGVPLLAAVLAQSGRPNAAALAFAGLEAATAVGLVEPVRGLDGGYRFPHGLARQAVLDLTGEFQRAQDNASVAGVLENTPAADLRVQRLADHYAAAAALGFTDKAVRYLAESAELAQAGLAHHEAARLFERAAAMAQQPVLRDELRLNAARGYLRSSRFGRARQLNEQVASAATGTDRLRAAIGYEAASWRSGQPGERSVQLLTDAMAGVTLDEHDPLSIRALAALGRAYAFTADVDKARCSGERATALARETGDDRLIAAALQIGLQRAAAPGQLSEKRAQAREISELTDRIGDLRHLGPASYHRAAIAYVQGDPAALAEAHNDMARAARVTGQQFWEWVASCLTFGMQFLHGDFAAALRTAGDAQESGRDFEPGHDTDGPSGLQAFMVRREIGGLEQVRPLISGEESVDDHWAPGLLGLYLELGLHAPAQRLLSYLLDRELPRHQISATWPFVLSLLVEAAAWLDDAGAARRLLPLTREYAGLNLMGGEFLAMVGSADRYIGILESMLGHGTASAHFVVAQEMDARMGSPVHLASTLAAEVAHLQRIGDRSGRAEQQVAEARRLAERHRLVRVQRLLDATRAGEPDPGEDRLTARETEVLRLVGAGLSNRQLAQQLQISENTAANHVRSILIKTGASNRTQAALYASARGLLVPEQPQRSAGHRLQ